MVTWLTVAGWLDTVRSTNPKGISLCRLGLEEGYAGNLNYP